jgi:hypothetical protein
VDICVERDGTYADADVHCSYPAFFRLIELLYRHGQLFQRLIQLQRFYTGKRIAPGRRIGDERPGAEIFQEPGGFENHRRVGLRRVPLCPWGDKIGFEQNAVAGLDKLF